MVDRHRDLVFARSNHSAKETIQDAVVVERGNNEESSSPENSASKAFREASELFNVGSYREAIPLFERAEAAYSALPRETYAAIAMGQRGICYRKLDEYPKAVEQFERCLKQLAYSPASTFQQQSIAHYSSLCGQVLYKQEKFAEAVKQFEISVCAANESGDGGTAANSQGWLADCLKELKNFSAAARAYQNTIERFQGLSDQKRGQKGVAINVVNLSHCFQELGEFDEAASAYQLHVDLLTRLFGESDPRVKIAKFGVVHCQCLGRASKEARDRRQHLDGAKFQNSILAYSKEV